MILARITTAAEVLPDGKFRARVLMDSNGYASEELVRTNATRQLSIVREANPGDRVEAAIQSRGEKWALRVVIFRDGLETREEAAKVAEELASRCEVAGAEAVVEELLEKN